MYSQFPLGLHPPLNKKTNLLFARTNSVIRGTSEKIEQNLVAAETCFYFLFVILVTVSDLITSDFILQVLSEALRLGASDLDKWFMLEI